MAVWVLLRSLHVLGAVMSTRQDRRAKRLRAAADDPSEQTLLLQSFLNAGGVSKLALRDLLRRVEGRPDLLVGAASRLSEAAEARWLLVRNTEMLPTLDGGHSDWEYCHPCLLMSMMIQYSPV